MGFIKEKQAESSIYTSVNKEQKVVRPLWKRPISYWQHWIAKVVVDRGGKAETLRNSGSEPCAENNTCTLCNTPDPLWDHLSPRDKFRKDGSRSDFGRSLRHGLPVWDYANQAVRMIVGGNSLFQGFDEAEDAGIDITTWDWIVWKSEKNNQTSYHAIRSDQPTQFTPPPGVEEAIQTVVSQFQKNDVECDSHENLILRIGSSMSGPWDKAFGQPQQSQQSQLPQQPMGALPAPGQPPMPTNNFVQAPSQIQMPQYTPPNMQQQPVPLPPTQVPQPGQPFGSMPQQQVFVPPQPQQQVFVPPQPQPVQQPQIPVSPPPVTPEPVPAPQSQVSVPQPPPQLGNTGTQEMTQEQMDRSVQVPTGKYQGKTLDWLMANDTNYFKGLGSFLKNYPDIVAARDRLQAGNYPAVSPPSAAVPPQQVPVVTAPVQNISSQPSVEAQSMSSQANVSMGTTSGSTDRDKLESEVNALFMSRSDLWMRSPQGVQAMADFLTNTIGTTAYNQASADQLLKLKQALEQHHVNNPQ